MVCRTLFEPKRPRFPARSRANGNQVIPVMGVMSSACRTPRIFSRISVVSPPIRSWYVCLCVPGGTFRWFRPPCSCRLRAVCVETGHAQRITRPVNTDRNDARGIAEMKRIGHYQPVHVKSVEAQLIRATLQARHQILAFRVTVDDPAHFDSSKAVGAHIGPTPRTYQSGESMGQGRSVRQPITYSAICSMRLPRR